MKFDQLILHPTTRKILADYLHTPTHALILTGENGVGLSTTAKVLAGEISGANTATIEPRLHNQQKTVSINIDDIRELNELTRTRRNDNFVILIDDTDKMTDQAPQAFLKLLEEPVANVFYILTSHNLESLPATIRSRAQVIEILPPPTDLVKKLLDNYAQPGLTAEKRVKIEFLGERRPAEIVRLLNNEEYYRDTAGAMETAKSFVQGNAAEKLKIVADNATRDTALILTKNVAKLLTMTAMRTKNQGAAAESLTTISETIDNLASNGNVKAQLLNLALNI